MLREDYTVTVVGRQTWDGEAGEISLNTTGTYIHRGGAKFVAYREYDPENPKVRYTALLKVEPGKVTLMRQGSATRLVLEEGRRHLCLYDTGYGTLSVGVFASQIRSCLSEEGGALQVRYTLDIDSNFTSENEITVEIRPQRRPAGAGNEKG